MNRGNVYCCNTKKYKCLRFDHAGFGMVKGDTELATHSTELLTFERCAV